MHVYGACANVHVHVTRILSPCPPSLWHWLRHRYRHECHQMPSVGREAPHAYAHSHAHAHFTCDMHMAGTFRRQGSLCGGRSAVGAPSPSFSTTTSTTTRATRSSPSVRGARLQRPLPHSAASLRNGYTALSFARSSQRGPHSHMHISHVTCTLLHKVFTARPSLALSRLVTPS